MNNNPVNFADPTGHYACGDGIDDPRCESKNSGRSYDHFQWGFEPSIPDLSDVTEFIGDVATGIGVEGLRPTSVSVMLPVELGGSYVKYSTPGMKALSKTAGKTVSTVNLGLGLALSVGPEQLENIGKKSSRENVEADLLVDGMGFLASLGGGGVGEIIAGPPGGIIGSLISGVVYDGVAEGSHMREYFTYQNVLSGYRSRISAAQWASRPTVTPSPMSPSVTPWPTSTPLPFTTPTPFFFPYMP